MLREVDVPAFVDLVVTRHRIGPLVHAALGRLPAEDLPAGLMEPLAEAARHNAVKALRAQRTHIMLARWFAQAGIDWMPFKGTTVALRYYEDAATRQVNDLDIWVPGPKLLQAREILATKGFRLDVAARHWDLAKRGPRHLDYLLRYYFEEQHYSAEFGALELHWHLTANPAQFNIAPQLLLDRADSIRLGGATMRVMNDVDLLLYLCEHGGRHGWYRLKWLADLPRLLAHRAWDWPAVLERARASGCLRTLLLGLAICEDLFGVARPEGVTRVVPSWWLASLAGRSVLVELRSVTRVSESHSRLPLSFRFLDVLRGLALSANWRAVRAHLWRYSLSPNDIVIGGLSDRWFNVYYLLRPLLFGVRQCRALFSRRT